MVTAAYLGDPGEETSRQDWVAGEQSHEPGDDVFPQLTVGNVETKECRKMVRDEISDNRELGAQFR